MRHTEPDGRGARLPLLALLPASTLLVFFALLSGPAPLAGQVPDGEGEADERAPSVRETPAVAADAPDTTETAAAPDTAGTDGAEPVGHAFEAPRAEAVRVDGSGFQIDGRVEEDGWFRAPAITRFTQIDPDEGAPPTQETDVRIVYDDEALYIGAMLYDTGEIRSRLARRDAGVPDADFFVVYIDSYHDHQTAYRFATNPSGQKRDEIVEGESSFGDTSWEPVWELATHVDDRGWYVEMRIPFSQLRFSQSEVQEWGIQLERKIRRRQEEMLFAFTPKLERGGVSRYGHLDGIRGIEPGRKLELLPYVGGRAEFVELDRPDDVDFDSPYRSGSDYFGNAGLDLMYGLSSNLTLNATVNPDFGQVEVDPAVINLSAFETRYDEKRPFFIEGADVFDFGSGGPGGSTGRPPQLLYSRRMGRAPQGAVPSSAAFADAPQSTTILGAAKLTGRTRDGWSVGLLEAVTQEERAPWIDGSGVRGESVVEPGSNYFVGRVRRDLRDGRTSFGVIGSAVNRSLGEIALAEELHSAAYSGGLDLTHEWNDRTWRLSGAVASSHVRGQPEALLSTQRSSARYFQRPDAGHVELDPAATSLTGHYGMASVAKQAGAYQARIATAAVGPGYEVNDLGFQTRADRYILDTTFSFRETEPGDVLRSWEIRGGPDAVWNFDGDRVFTEFNVFGNWELLNYWGGGGRFAFNPATDDDELTRGGPLARTPRGYSGNLNVSSDSRQRLSGRLQYSWNYDEGDSWRRSANLRLNYRYAESWEFSLSPRFTRSFSSAQYVTSVEDPLATATYGERYLFAGLDQTTLSMDTRVNVTFTPTLSFELFAQPFLSSGDYGALEELRAPRTYEFLRYGDDLGTIERGEDGYYEVDPDGAGPADAFSVADRDFSYRSLLGNAVLRWEWRPGSTLYLVWQQDRSQRVRAYGEDPLDDRVGDFTFRRDADRLLGIAPDNIFLLKVNYWLNP